MNFLKKNRAKLFPGLNDFNREYKEFKYKSFKDHANVMDYLWFSPEFYTFIQYFPIIVYFSIIVTLLFVPIPIYYKLIITLVVYVLSLRKLSILKKMQPINNNTNLYEMYIKN